MALSHALPSHAYAPQVVAAIARRISSVLPLAARWDPAWDAAIAAEVERELEAEDADPERFSSSHRFIAGGSAPDPSANETAAGSAAIIGAAPRLLAATARDLESAFSGGQASLIILRLADLATHATDLADPFLVTAPDQPEVPRSHANFSDLIEERDLAGITPTPPAATADALNAGRQLALASSHARIAVEVAHSAGNSERLRTLRLERLGAALGLARGIALSAWREAGSPSLVGAVPSQGTMRAWPNPASGVVTLSFVLPVAGRARVELFDLAGRRRWSTELGPSRAGPQQIAINASAWSALKPGVYLARVSAPSYQASGRILRVRG